MTAKMTATAATYDGRWDISVDISSRPPPSMEEGIPTRALMRDGYRLSSTESANPDRVSAGWKVLALDSIPRVVARSAR